MNYEISEHAKDAMGERRISVTWLEQVLSQPEQTRAHSTDTELEHRFGRIVEHGNRVLHVVVNKQTTPERVVTVYFDRTMKGKL